MKIPIPRVAAALSLAAAALLAQPVQAAPVPVNNHSFENGSYGGGTWANLLTDPTLADPTTSPDWLGRDDGIREIPSIARELTANGTIPFSTLTAAEREAVGDSLPNVFDVKRRESPRKRESR